MNTKKTASKKVASSMLDMMAGAAMEPEQASNASLTELANIVQLRIEQAQRVELMEEQLKEMKANLLKLDTVDIPETMKACGMKSFTTKDDFVVDLEEDVKCGIPAARRGEAYEWLREHGFDGLIKSQLSVSFDKDHLEEADQLVDELKQEGYEVDVEQSIHYQTLKAFVKERLADVEAEVAIPHDLFGIFPYTVAKIKAKKSKK